MAELDELKLLERWFSILTNSCLVVIPMYNVFLSQDKYIYRQHASRKERVKEI